MVAATCESKRIKSVKLCIGDLTHLVEIQQRTLGESDFGAIQPVETFTTLVLRWCAIETVGAGVARFAKINVLDDATHIFWTPWDAEMPNLEIKNRWILYDGRRFKILKVDNINETYTTLAIQTTERGDSTLEASEA